MIFIVIILLVIIGMLSVEIYDLRKTHKSIKESMHMLLNVQGQHGAFDYNEYELGIWQGMENMLAKFEDRKPTYIPLKKVNFINNKVDKLQKNIDDALKVLSKNRTKNEKKVYMILRGDKNANN